MADMCTYRLGSLIYSLHGTVDGPAVLLGGASTRRILDRFDLSGTAFTRTSRSLTSGTSATPRFLVELSMALDHETIDSPISIDGLRCGR